MWYILLNFTVSPLSEFLCPYSILPKSVWLGMPLWYTPHHYILSLLVSWSILLGSNPGLLTPVFVACSTNMGEGLVTLITCSDVPGCVEEWHIPPKNASKWVHYWSQTRAVEWLSAQHQTVLVTFLGFRKPLYSCTEWMCHSSTRPWTSLHVISFTRPSPTLVLQATNAGVRRPGYQASITPNCTLSSLVTYALYGILPNLHWATSELPCNTVKISSVCYSNLRT